MLSIIIILLIISNSIYVQGLKCYTCTTSENDKDQRCVTNPGSVEGNGITDCNKAYCTTNRVEYIDPKDKVQSMNRDCVDKPIYNNEIFEDGTYRVYYTSCRFDLCNGGSGKDITAGSGVIHENGDAIVLYVPGTKKENSASLIYLSNILFALTIVYHIFVI